MSDILLIPLAVLAGWLTFKASDFTRTRYLRERWALSIQYAAVWRAVWDGLGAEEKAAFRGFFEAFQFLPPYVSWKEGWSLSSSGTVIDLPEEVKARNLLTGIVEIKHG